MKIFRTLLFTSALGLSLLGGRSLVAQDTPTAPVVVPTDRDDRDLIRDLKGAPAPVKALILSFDATRDKFLAEQRELRIKLRKATTEEQREKIREQLQDNRQAFLAQLKDFRQDLRKDLRDLKGKISHAEFERILDAAKDAAKEGQRHKGTGKP